MEKETPIQPAFLGFVIVWIFTLFVGHVEFGEKGSQHIQDVQFAFQCICISSAIAARIAYLPEKKEKADVKKAENAPVDVKILQRSATAISVFIYLCSFAASYKTGMIFGPISCLIVMTPDFEMSLKESKEPDVRVETDEKKDAMSPIESNGREGEEKKEKKTPEDVGKK